MEEIDVASSTGASNPVEEAPSPNCAESPSQQRPSQDNECGDASGEGDAVELVGEAPAHQLHQSPQHLPPDGESEDGELLSCGEEEEEGEGTVGSDEGEVTDEEKEEGELEEGELSSDSEDGQKNGKKDVCKHYLRGVCTWGDGCNFAHPAEKEGSEAVVIVRRGRRGARPPSASALPESTHGATWERALKQAKEMAAKAMRRKEEPDFERKRLLLPPSAESLPLSDSDSDSDSRWAEGRRHQPQPRRHETERRRGRPEIRVKGIPSLLDIRPPSPPRLRIIHPDPSRFAPRVLGPQVLYPNGRPVPQRERERSPRKKSPRREREKERPREKEKERERERPHHRDEKRRIGMAAALPTRKSSPKSSEERLHHTKRDSDGRPPDPWERSRKGMDKRERKESDSVSHDSRRGRPLSPMPSSQHRSPRKSGGSDRDGSRRESETVEKDKEQAKTGAVESSSSAESSSSSSTSSTTSSRSNSPTLPARYRLTVNEAPEKQKKEDSESDEEEAKRKKECPRSKKISQHMEEKSVERGERKAVGKEAEETSSHRQLRSPNSATPILLSSSQDRKRVHSTSGDSEKKEISPPGVKREGSPLAKRGKRGEGEKRKQGGQGEKRRTAGGDRATEQRKHELRMQLKEIEERLNAAKKRRGISS